MTRNWTLIINKWPEFEPGYPRNKVISVETGIGTLGSYSGWICFTFCFDVGKAWIHIFPSQLWVKQPGRIYSIAFSGIQYKTLHSKLLYWLRSGDPSTLASHYRWSSFQHSNNHTWFNYIVTPLWQLIFYKHTRLVVNTIFQYLNTITISQTQTPIALLMNYNASIKFNSD